MLTGRKEEISMLKLSKPSVAILAGACAVIVPTALYAGPTALETFAGSVAPGAAAIPSRSSAPAPAIRTVATVGGTGGIAVVFNRPSGAFGLGHVGWGVYDPDSGQWTYGSGENQSGQANVPAGGDNGAWSQTGDFGDMTSAMNARGYSGAVSIPVTDPNLAAALGNAAAQPGEGYNLFGNNCADAVYNLLNDYGVD